MLVWSEPDQRKILFRLAAMPDMQFLRSTPWTIWYETEPIKSKISKPVRFAGISLAGGKTDKVL